MSKAALAVYSSAILGLVLQDVVELGRDFWFVLPVGLFLSILALQEGE